MAAKRVARLVVGLAAMGVAVPLIAQQSPTTQQPSQVPLQSPKTGNQPAIPSEPAAPKPRMLPRRAPTPSVSVPGSVAPQSAEEAEGDPAASVSEETGAGSAPAPVRPQRRIAPPPAGGMVSLNFNRADLVEIIHIIAQQLRLTYTIDPNVKGTVTINSAEPLRPEDLLPEVDDRR